MKILDNVVSFKICCLVLIFLFDSSLIKFEFYVIYVKNNIFFSKYIFRINEFYEFCNFEFILNFVKN